MWYSCMGEEGVAQLAVDVGLELLPCGVVYRVCVGGPGAVVYMHVCTQCVLRVAQRSGMCEVLVATLRTRGGVCVRDYAASLGRSWWW